MILLLESFTIEAGHFRDLLSATLNTRDIIRKFDLQFPEGPGQCCNLWILILTSVADVYSIGKLNTTVAQGKPASAVVSKFCLRLRVTDFPDDGGNTGKDGIRMVQAKSLVNDGEVWAFCAVVGHDA